MNVNVKGTTEVRLRKIGNSEGVIIPKDVLERYGLKSGDVLELSEGAGEIALKAKASGTSDFDRKMEMARKVMDKYKVALQKLAE